MPADYRSNPDRRCRQQRQLADARNSGDDRAMGALTMKPKAQSFTHTIPREGAEPFTHTTTIVPAGVDPKEALQQAMDDCPECQAARARGETPTVLSGEDVRRIARAYEQTHGAPDPETRQMRRARERRMRRRAAN